jgi:hypothetical protein
MARWIARSLPLATAPLLAVVALAGCGGGASQSPTRTHHETELAPRPTPPGFGSPRIPTPPPTGTAPNPDAVKVIRAWSSALRRGDVRTAASYFSVPSELLNGGNGTGIELTIHTLAEAEAANETLPCGATFISADQRGRYTNALFRLTGRPGPGGSNCGGGGTTARTNFLVEQGKIVEWIRAPDDPGDNGGPPSPAGGTNTV